jgi:hypothetical protein
MARYRHLVEVTAPKMKASEREVYDPVFDWRLAFSIPYERMYYPVKMRCFYYPLRSQHCFVLTRHCSAKCMWALMRSRGMLG